MAEGTRTGKPRRKSASRTRGRSDPAEDPSSLETSAGLLRDIARLIARANALRAEYDMLRQDFRRADAELERTIRQRRINAAGRTPLNVHGNAGRNQTPG